MADRDNVKKAQAEFPAKILLGDNRNAIEIRIWCGLIVQLLLMVAQTRVKKKWAYSNMVSMVRLHLMSYIDLFSFMENPTQKWVFLNTKTRDIQMKLF